MKNFLKDDKAFYFIVGIALLIPIIIGLTYIFVFVIYQIFIISPAKKRIKKKIKTDKEIFEVKYLIYKYKLDLDKISYNQLIQICALVSS